jgi:DNA repair protein RadD
MSIMGKTTAPKNIRYKWVYHPDDRTARLHDVGILADGTLHNPNGYSDDLVRNAVLVAQARRRERRSQAAKQAAVTRKRRQEQKVAGIARRYLAGRKIFGPKSYCMICGKGCTDPASIERAIGSDCWQQVLSAVQAATAPNMPHVVQPVQIARVQTLMRRRIPSADVVFVDGAHRWFDFYREWFRDPAWRDVPIIGLSATPWTKGLGAHYDVLIIAATTRELIDQGYLSKFKVFAPDHPDLRGVRTIADDYHEGDLGEVMDKQPLVADIVETWKKHGFGRPMLCFAVNRVHAKHLQKQFEEAGFRTGYVDCFTPPEERTIIRRKFQSGELQLVCNVGVLTIGIDWDVHCIILARPTKSEIRFVQIIGRGLRLAEGKDHCLILDYSDTTSRLGFVTDIHHDELHDGKARECVKRDHVKLPKECPQCHCLRPPTKPTCPNCGFVAKPVNKIEPVDGQLVEMVSRSKATSYDPAERARWHGELTYMQRSRGYKAGWVFAKYKEKFGTWPPPRQGR